MNYRIAKRQDIPIMISLRKKQLIDEGIKPEIDIDKQLQQYFEEKLSDGSLVEWLLEDGETVVATAAIAFIELPPTYTNQSGIRGYITNMYTAPELRGKGIASQMLEKLMEEAEKRSVHKIFLYASKLGKAVYEKYGFTESGGWMEMTL